MIIFQFSHLGLQIAKNEWGFCAPKSGLDLTFLEILVRISDEILGLSSEDTQNRLSWGLLW